MLKWVWRKLEPFVDGLITRRIVKFHDAMIQRGQIPAIKEEDPIENSAL